MNQYLLKEIIPPADYAHRNGFNNVPIIKKLTDTERAWLEKELIIMLQSESVDRLDPLIVETLAYLKSDRSLPLLGNFLEICTSDVLKLILATAIFEISADIDMVDIALDAVKRMDNKKDAYYVHKLTSAFYCLAKFDNKKVDKVIREYIHHPEHLVSYNAARALEIRKGK